MRSILLLLLTASAIQQGISQSFYMSDQEVRITYEDFINSKLDGLLPLDSLRTPDEEFHCLSLLGDPKIIRHTEYVMMGEEIEYIYASGLALSFSALSQPEYQIVNAKISNYSFLELSDGNRLAVGSFLSDVIKDFEQVKSKYQSEDALTIKVDLVDISRIYLTFKNYQITTITVWF